MLAAKRKKLLCVFSENIRSKGYMDIFQIVFLAGFIINLLAASWVSVRLGARKSLFVYYAALLVILVSFLVAVT